MVLLLADDDLAAIHTNGDRVSTFTSKVHRLKFAGPALARHQGPIILKCLQGAPQLTWGAWHQSTFPDAPADGS